MRTIRRTGVLLVLLAGAVATLGLFVWPPTGPAGRADAVVVLLGGSGERLTDGERLVATEVAPTLVVSGGGQPGSTVPPGICAAPRSYEVVCPSPPPSDTRDEARMVGRLAAERGWRRVVVVTSTYHVTRARLLVARCFKGDLAMADAGTGGRSRVNPGLIAHELGGLAYAMTLARGC